MGGGTSGEGLGGVFGKQCTPSPIPIVISPLPISTVISCRKPVLLSRWKRKHCIFEKKVTQEGTAVGNKQLRARFESHLVSGLPPAEQEKGLHV